MNEWKEYEQFAVCFASKSGKARIESGIEDGEETGREGKRRGEGRQPVGKRRLICSDSGSTCSTSSTSKQA